MTNFALLVTCLLVSCMELLRDARTAASSYHLFPQSPFYYNVSTCTQDLDISNTQKSPWKRGRFVFLQRWVYATCTTFVYEIVAPPYSKDATKRYVIWAIQVTWYFPFIQLFDDTFFTTWLQLYVCLRFLYSFFILSRKKEEATNPARVVNKRSKSLLFKRNIYILECY